MDDRSVPYIVYEGTAARFERIIKRLMILLILAVVMLFASNAFWLYEWNQYDYADVDINSEDGGNDNYLQAGANGVISNGESKGSQENQEEQAKR